MRRCFVLLSLLTVPLAAQDAARRLLDLADELEVAMKAGNWTRAAKISGELKDSAERARNDSMMPANRELAEKILTWLPVDAQTFVVAQRPFTVPEPDETKETASALDIAHGFLLMPLAGVDEGKLVTDLAERVIQFAALTGRSFGEDRKSVPGQRRNLDLGPIPYEGCGIYAFVDPLPEGLLGREPEESIMGYRSWISNGSLATLLKPNTLMVCNNGDFFREMLTRMGVPALGRALPESLAEWKYVDRTAVVWGLSHYASGPPFWRAVLPKDPSTPPTGVSIAFGSATGEAHARMLSGEDPWIGVEKITELDGAVKTRAIGDGAWEIAVDSKQEAASLAALLLMGLVGFVVII